MPTVPMTMQKVILQFVGLSSIVSFIVLDTDNSQLIKKCGTTTPSKIISSGNKLTVKFHSDSSVSFKGFKATWKVVTATEGGSIKSEGFPNNYPNNKEQVNNCPSVSRIKYLIIQTWNLSVSEGKKIQLTFDEFSIENHASCVYDSVSVQYGTFSQKYCGTTAPSPITSTGNTMTVKFASDSSVTDKGFSAVWKAVD